MPPEQALPTGHTVQILFDVDVQAVVSYVPAMQVLLQFTHILSEFALHADFKYVPGLQLPEQLEQTIFAVVWQGDEI